MISAMIIVVTSWLVAFCLLAGIGQLIRLGSRLPPLLGSGWFDAFWIGYAALIGLLEAWHLALPIDWRTCLAIGVVGVVGVLWALKSQNLTVRSQSQIAKRWILLALVLIIPLAFWIANRALDAQTDFDTGLYHLSTIRWTNDYPVVPGLGNLHYRLAFNQSTFLFVALLNIHPYFGQGLHIANSLLVMALAAQLIFGIARSIDAITKSKVFTANHLIISLYGAIWLPIVIYRASRQPYSANVSSPSPDLPVFILMTVVSVLFVRYLFAPPDSEQESCFTIFSISALSVIGVTTKLSFGVFAVVTITLTIGICLVRHREQIRELYWSVLAAIIAASIIALPWLLHGIITSGGYPLFPNRIGMVKLDYAIPIATAKEAEDWVYSFAREPQTDSEIVFRDWSWLPGWFSRMDNDFNAFLFYIPFFLALGMLLLFAVIIPLLWLSKRKLPIDPRLLLPFLPAIGSGLFWFFTAPDPRFAGSTFWILALWSSVLLISVIRLTHRVWFYLAIATPTTITVIFILFGFHANFTLTGKGFPTIPRVPVREYHTEFGLIVYIPSINNLLLWDAPLPSSPYEISRLEMRGEGLRDGFRTRPEE